MDVAKNAEHLVANTKSGFLDALGYVGLQRGRSLTLPIAALAVGLVVGASVVLLLSPTTRMKLAGLFSKAEKKVETEVEKVVEKVEKVAEKVTGAVDETNGRPKHA